MLRWLTSIQSWSAELKTGLVGRGAGKSRKASSSRSRVGVVGWLSGWENVPSGRSAPGSCPVDAVWKSAQFKILFPPDSCASMTSIRRPNLLLIEFVEPGSTLCLIFWYHLERYSPVTNRGSKISHNRLKREVECRNTEKKNHYLYLTYKSAWYFFPFRTSRKVGIWLFLKFRLESYTAAAAPDTWQQLDGKYFDFQIHANNPAAHQFLGGFAQLPRILWSWVEGGTSVWVNLCSLPPACWSGAFLAWSVFLHRTAKTTQEKQIGKKKKAYQKSKWGWHIPRSSLGNHAGSGDSLRRSFCPLPTSFCRKLSPGSTTSSQWLVYNLTPFWPSPLSSGKDFNNPNCLKTLKQYHEGHLAQVLTPRTPNLSQKVHPHRKSISNLWLRTTMAFSFP